MSEETGPTRPTDDDLLRLCDESEAERDAALKRGWWGAWQFSDGRAAAFQPCEAAFIAACSPAVVRGLIERWNTDVGALFGDESSGYCDQDSIYGQLFAVWVALEQIREEDNSTDDFVQEKATEAMAIVDAVRLRIAGLVEPVRG